MRGDAILVACAFQLFACGGTREPRALPFAAEKDEPPSSPSPEFANPASGAVLEGEASTVLVLREPSRPLDASHIARSLLERLRSGVPSRVADAFTEDLVIVGGASRIFAPGPAPRRMLEGMIRYPGELEELAAIRFRDQRVMSRRGLQESASPFFSSAARGLPAQLPSELVLVVAVESPSRVLFPSRGRTLLLLREDQGVFRIRAIVDDTTSSAP